MEAAKSNTLKRNTNSILIPDKTVDEYRKVARSLVEKLMEYAVSKDETFAGYKIIPSGSTAEGVRVGNPFEMDFLIQYDIDVKSVEEVPECKGFVYITPDSTKFQHLQNHSGLLSSDQIMFRFFMLLFHYDELPRHDEKDPLVNLDLRYKFDEKDKFGGKKKVDVSNFRRVTSLGAALPFIIQKPGCMMGSQSTESLDIVLSFHLNGYWPDCAAEWKEKYKTKLAKEAYDWIIQCGVSTVCKTPPVQKADTVKNLPLMFRLSFSRAETKLMNLVTPEQKEAYKCLKMLRETELNDYRFLGLRLGGFLKKKFTSYHLKSLFLTLTTGNDEEKSASEWFVVLLNEVLRGLANREIRHHFISGINLLENASIEDDLQREFRINWFQRDLPFYDPPMLRIDFEKTIEVSKEWFRRYKSKLVPSEYLAVYDTDQCELDTCMILRKVFEDALHNHDSSRFQELQQKCLYQNSYDCLGFSE